jgi:hypothetical protein
MTILDLLAFASTALGIWAWLSMLYSSMIAGYSLPAVLAVLLGAIFLRLQRQRKQSHRIGTVLAYVGIFVGALFVVSQLVYLPGMSRVPNWFGDASGIPVQ